MRYYLLGDITFIYWRQYYFLLGYTYTITPKKRGRRGLPLKNRVVGGLTPKKRGRRGLPLKNGVFTPKKRGCRGLPLKIEN